MLIDIYIYIYIYLQHSLNRKGIMAFRDTIPVQYSMVYSGVGARVSVVNVLILLNPFTAVINVFY